MNYSLEFIEDLDLKVAVEELSPADRELIILFLYGYTQEEIGEAIGASQSVVSRRLQGIIEHIREKSRR